MLRRLNILILEDRPEDFELEVHQLRQDNLEFDWQHVDNEADYRAALNQRPDVIIADYTLPQFNALAALRVLKQLNLDIPFIVVTGTVGEEAVIECMKQGAADYLLKDRLARLGTAIQHALEEKTIREQKRAVEQQLTRLTENAADIIFRYRIKPTPELEYINSAITAVLGYSVEECYAQKDPLIHCVYPDDRANFWQLSVIGGESGEALQLRMVHKDGTIIWAEQRNTLVCDEESQVIAIEGIIRDITERKHLEEEMHRAELLSAELEKEKELTELKERFTSMVSHEFRTPLTVILTSTNLLEEHFDKLTPEKRARHWHQIKSQVQYMVGLLDDVLTLSRAQAGKIEFTPKLLNIENYCRTLLDQMNMAQGAGRELVFLYTSQYKEALLDEQLLQHILVNLLSNALKYSAPDKPVHFEVFDDMDCVVFQISDQGIGIPLGDQPRLFEVFHRAKNARSVSGTGLGLSIVKNSVDLHGGSITFESEEGVGTTFTVRLPVNK